MKAKEIMNTEFSVLTLNHTLSDAMRLLLVKSIDGTVIVDNRNKVINVVTKTDILKAIDNKLGLDAPLSKLPIKEVVALREEGSLEDIKELNFGILSVVNDRGNLIGIITEEDILKEINYIEILKCGNCGSSGLMCYEMDSIIECSYDGIYITDGEGNTIRINKSYEDITGLKRKDMLGRNMRDLEKEGYISKSGTLVALEAEKGVTMEQSFNTGKKVIISSSPIFDSKGKISLVVTNVRDVTGLYELKEQVEKNKKLTEKYYQEIEEMRTQLLKTDDIIANDEKMLKVIRMAKRVAKVDTTVLILGGTGVGKEKIARFIHKNSTRGNKQFIEINCGAIPETLIEAELFGYEKGAFTGAKKEGKMGLFEVAEGGTLFLDEIGELPLDMQVKLLRALQEREITRIGGVKPIKIDVRIVAATNRNLEEMIKKKLFREDLYYRLNVVPVKIPPLKERKQDIIPLVKNFLNEFNKKYDLDKSFTSKVLSCFYEYSWPGNVRELRNIVERVIIMSNDDKISSQDLPNAIKVCLDETIVEEEEKIMPLKESVEKLEKKLIFKAFEKYGNVRGAAKALKIDPSTFVRKRKKYTNK